VDTSAVGVIGLGNMGRGIATNLGKHGRPVYVWDLKEAARERFEDKAGFTIAPQGEMAKHCAAIFFLVPATPEIKACLEGENGIVANARAGLILCDLTTSDPLATRALAEELSAHGIHYIDAGTSGGPTRADSGELTLMVGGDAGAFERAKPFLNDVAKTIYYLGASGSGHTMKLLHNVVCHATFFATTEALRLGERAGLKLGDMVEVLNNSNARSYVTESRYPKHILSKKWDGRSRIFNMHKDIKMGVELGHRMGSGTEFSEATLRYLDKAVRRGMSEDDYTLIYRDFDEIRATEADGAAETNQPAAKGKTRAGAA
jgi:3-hydroxyisobutyrate dehydrogenase